MSPGRPDPWLVKAWLTARSVARGLPAPVPDSGGWRVDTGTPEERRRYLFADPLDGLCELGREIEEPAVPLKLCRSGEVLMALLPSRWQLSAEAWMMVRDMPPGVAFTLEDPYRLTVAQRGALTTAVIRDETGEIAASGHAADHDGVRVYDRIVTEAAHRRRGLGCAIMAALSECRHDRAAREILVATEAGRRLYRTVGWRDYCPYATAIIPPA